VNIININPLTKILAIINKRTFKQAEQNLSEKQDGSSLVKTVLTKQIKKSSPQSKIPLTEQQQENATNQTNPVIPAPLKTTLFEKAQFFYRELPTGNPETSGGTGTLLIKLETISLGKLWITVASSNDTLMISFFNNKKASIDLIKENLSALKEELLSSDFKNIYLKCQVSDDTWLQNNIIKNFLQDNISFINFKV